jgi:GMC oxidoreductase
MTDDPKIGRRGFLGGAGAAAATLAPDVSPPAQAQTPPPTAAAPSTAAPATEAWLTLTQTEAAFIEAAVNTLIPADDLSPSGSDCGVAVFIDQAWDADNLFVMGASVFPQNASYNPTGLVGALAYWSADAITKRYLKNPGPLVQA